MEYLATFSISFRESDDATANEIAQQHYDQIHDAIRVEGADHPYKVTLEHVEALEAAGSRTVPMSERRSKPI
jgi:DNA-binding FadR family transcriptional regulator